jgi:hypothetical protein
MNDQRPEQEFSSSALDASAGNQRPTTNDQRPTSDGAPFKPQFGLSGDVPEQNSQRPTTNDQRPSRVLALFEISETDDLGAAFVRLFAPHSGYRERLRSGRCFVRFTPVADAAQRQSAARALREWLHNTPSDDATASVTANNETISAA